jgi:hypothetical protein
VAILFGGSPLRRRPGERLGSWTVDFAFVDPVSMRVLAVVVVRDVDGDRARARGSDGVAEAAGVPLVKVPAAGSVDAVELRRELGEAPVELLNEMV